MRVEACNGRDAGWGRPCCDLLYAVAIVSTIKRVRRTHAVTVIVTSKTPGLGRRSQALHQRLDARAKRQRNSSVTAARLLRDEPKHRAAAGVAGSAWEDEDVPNVDARLDDMH